MAVQVGYLWDTCGQPCGPQVLIFYSCPGHRPWARVIKCVVFFYLCPGRRPSAQVIKCVGFLYYFSSARKWTNCAIVSMRPCGLHLLYFPDSWNETSKKRSDWNFSRVVIVLSLKLTLTYELLKLNSALKLILSVIEGQCSGGQWSSKWGGQDFKTSSG